MDERQLERLKQNLGRCRTDMRRAAELAGRDPADVALLAVTKYVEPDTIRLLHRAGVRDFGESRVQRGWTLREQLADLDDVRFHLIGHLQRNKVRRALQSFHSLHSVDSMRLARELVLQKAAVGGGAAPALYVEVNVAREPQKTGLLEEDLDDVLLFLRNDGTYPVRGLMTMPPRGDSPEESRPHFRRLRELRDDRVSRNLLPRNGGLSMGMSEDFVVGIEEGATVVRIGSLLFEGI